MRRWDPGLPLRALRGVLPAAREVLRPAIQSAVQPSERFDSLLLLPGEVLPGGRAGPGFQAAIEAAASGFHQGWAPTVLVTGATPDRPPGEAVVARAALLALGVPSECILSEDKSRNLAGALHFARPCLDGPRPRVLLVGGAREMPRAVFLAEREGMEVRVLGVAGSVVGLGREIVALALVRAEAGGADSRGGRPS